MIKAVLKTDWNMPDGSTNPTREVNVPAGTHELERIPNPLGFQGNWLVLKGTRVGMAENAWKQWINDVPGSEDSGKPTNWGKFEIILEEDGTVVPPLQD